MSADKLRAEQEADAEALADAYQTYCKALAMAREANAVIDKTRTRMTARNSALETAGRKDLRISPDVVRAKAVGDAVGGQASELQLDLSRDARTIDKVLRDLATPRRLKIGRSTMSLAGPDKPPADNYRPGPISRRPSVPDPLADFRLARRP